MRAALEETERSVAFDFALRTATSLPTPAHAAIAVTAAAHAAAAARATPTPSATTTAAANSLLRQCAHVKGSEADSKDTSCSCVLRIPGHRRPMSATILPWMMPLTCSMKWAQVAIVVAVPHLWKYHQHAF